MSKLSRLLTHGRTLGLLAAVAAATWLSLRGLPDGRLHVYFLDVGQGDAIFIVAPDGQQILVDGGPASSALLGELGDLMPFWDRSLDMVILTHPDNDHMGGLLALPARYRIHRAVDALGADPGEDAASWIQVLADAGVPRVAAEQGARLCAGDACLTVLHPGAANASLPDAGNRNSLVLRLDHGATSFLLTADAPAETERALLEGGSLVDADVLKVGHHGSAGSTTEAFIEAVSPRLAVIQVGADNAFGHPASEVVERLRHAEVLRTDQNGRVEVLSDGRQLTVRSQTRP